MSQSNFLCTRCRRALCPDCRSIADEYAQLLHNAQQERYFGTEKIEKLEQDLAAAERRAKMWEDLSKIGLPELMRQWMDERIAKQERVSKRLAHNDAVIQHLTRRR